MKRNRANSLLPALALSLFLAAGAGCKKEEPKRQAAPMPKYPVPTKPQPTPAAPAAGPAAPAAPAAPGIPAAAVGVGPAVQQQSSSALRKRGAQLDFKNRTDPFKPYALVEAAPVAPAGTERKEVRREDLLPIQSYDVSKFKVVGIIAGLKQNKALILDPAGKGYVVQEGMPLGSNEGRITRITSSSLEVVETYKEGRGHVKKRKIVLTLAKKR